MERYIWSEGILKEILNNDVIEEFSSSCAGYRGVNDFAMKGSYSLLRIDDTIDVFVFQVVLDYVMHQIHLSI